MRSISSSHHHSATLQCRGLFDVFHAKMNSEIQKAGRILRLHDAARKAVTAPQDWVTAGFRCLGQGWVPRTDCPEGGSRWAVGRDRTHQGAECLQHPSQRMGGVKVFCGGSCPGRSSPEAGPGMGGFVQGMAAGVWGASSDDTSALPHLKARAGLCSSYFSHREDPGVGGWTASLAAPLSLGPVLQRRSSLLPALTAAAAAGTVRRPAKGTRAGPRCIHCRPRVALETHAQRWWGGSEAQPGQLNLKRPMWPAC